MTVLDELVSRPKPPALARLIARHQVPTNDTGVRMAEWGRSGGTHHKDGVFFKK
ncbi:multiple cyclophane-containing RiPP AmcA [Actinokineospora enzanensis]|uniref:multiple cyclophane-containing RiPP AmcA n=1 Tax=Actinokineospora enzanensis TaxID=155975 RepID=UPI00035D490C|nr:multiple cyclophane-containing RiPP AmcA [Actinokineospora enzanensis]